MATFAFPARRLILAGGFAAAVVAAPALAALTLEAPAGPALAACPTGESEDTFTGSCTPELVPNSPEFGNTSPGGLPSIDGVPCTGGNSGQCIGLSEDQPQFVEPHTSVSSSP
ncbi:intersectin-EH binding protein Ibp1 [Mycolicibacterium cosmeticum]|uniref:intersectin-EH binding protein Ibp1 n=1 Tax=Mycolicibacterium cosmeticum TaxID=258533 RepID=UPI0032047FDF